MVIFPKIMLKIVYVCITTIIFCLAVESICSTYDKMSETQALDLLKKKILKGKNLT